MSSVKDAVSSPTTRRATARSGPVARDSNRNGTGRRAEDRRLLLRYHRWDDIAARDELVERSLPLARRLARRYQHPHESLDDLVQVAAIGLMKAIDRFDPGLGTAFTSYAVPTILGELKRHFRDNGWGLRVPRGMQERVLEVSRAADELAGRLGRAPSPSEVAEAIGAGAEEVLEAMDAAAAYEPLSLESAPAPDHDADGAGYLDRIGSDDGGYDLVEYGASIEPALRSMPERERRILHLRFAEDLTQSEIAERIGVSQMHVSRLIRRAVGTLRAAADPDAGSTDDSRSPLPSAA
jgi:RNA polymerase sigma-B factor